MFKNLPQIVNNQIFNKNMSFQNSTISTKESALQENKDCLWENIDFNNGKNYSGKFITRKSPLIVENGKKNWYMTNNKILVNYISPFGHINGVIKMNNIYISKTLGPQWNDGNWVIAPKDFGSEICRDKEDAKELTKELLSLGFNEICTFITKSMIFGKKMLNKLK
jgi:hypothetical protein